MSSCNECGEPLVDGECSDCGIKYVFDYSDFEVKFAVTALLDVGQYSYKVGQLWPNSNEVCKKFVNLVEAKFKRKNKFHSYYGSTLKDIKKSMPNRLLKYLKTHNFVALAEEIVGEIASEASDVNTRPGISNVVFVHYSSDDEGDQGRFLVLMLDKKNGFDFDNNLVPKNAEHINLDSLKQAALIDLTLFDELFPLPPTDEAYLRFINGNSSSEYFKKALGCEIKADNGRSINELSAALESFQVEMKLPNKFYDKVKAKFEAAYSKALKNKHDKSISLDYMVDLVESELPDKSKLKGRFINYVNDNYQVNEYIEPTHHAAEEDKWVNVKAVDETYTAKVYRKKIGKPGSGSAIEFDADANKLMLRVDDQSARISLRRLIGLDDE